MSNKEALDSLNHEDGIFHEPGEEFFPETFVEPVTSTVPFRPLDEKWPAPLPPIPQELVHQEPITKINHS